ncbi:MAG TPA: acyltransferase [Sphingomonas sp.]|nr:acyltransferase [Sphingomonas sp.]
MASRPVVGAKTNFHSIDVLRGIAAITILIFHYQNLRHSVPGQPTPHLTLDSVPLLAWLWPIRQEGGLAVMLFWMISGFVFMNVYAGTRPRASTFWVNRIARLYPLHLLTLLLVAAIQICAMRQFGQWLIYPDNTLKNFLLQLFFASAWVPPVVHSFNGPIWSVSIEILIYALFYLYARFARVNAVTTMVALIASVVTASALHGAILAVCATFFTGGMLTYIIYQAWPKRAVWLLLTLSLAAFVLFNLAVWRFDARAHLPLTALFLPIFGSAITAAAASEHLFLANAYRRLQFVGDITYSTYLLHMPLQILFLFGVGLGFWQQQIVFSATFFLLYLAVVCILGFLSFHTIERPAQRWIRGWVSKGNSRKQIIESPERESERAQTWPEASASIAP